MDRRDFVKTGAAAVTSLNIGMPLYGREKMRPASPDHGRYDGRPRMRWLGMEIPEHDEGVCWGVSWPEGVHGKKENFRLHGKDGEAIAMQSWPMAYWPDGSLKWTGHAIPANAGLASELILEAGTPASPDQPVKVKMREGAIEVDNGLMKVTIARSGNIIIPSIHRGPLEIARNGALVAMTRSATEPDKDTGIQCQSFEGIVEDAEVEQDGPVRAVIKVIGKHRGDAHREWLPFTVRLYVYAESESLRLSHTIVFDGDEHTDFLSGLGLRLEVPFREATHERHIRFSGENGGVWAEAVKGITGLRRDPGLEVRRAQVAGEATPPLADWNPRVTDRMHWIPDWGDFSLSQLSANAFTVRKRTKPGHGWIAAAQGGRASGLGYVGDISGGLAFGMRDFWQAHPSQLDIRNAHTGVAQATLWFWSPEAQPMDLRFYHDGLGQEGWPDQLDAMEITYEDYEPGFGTPYGLARTSEAVLWAVPKTPSRDEFASMARRLQDPPRLMARPVDHLSSGVFGSLWTLPDTSSPAKAAIEERLEWAVDYYANQVEQHHWYGFWDYGDFMHTYDPDRHVWRYDIGGYAWANSELSPDLWIWYSFLRTGRKKAFMLADALTRHTRDVDIYHAGRFAGLGTRHNVQHWGCSAKQLRISTSAYRRFHYYLTTDERTGDVLSEVTEADHQLGQLVPTRKLPDRDPLPGDARIGVGTDWGSAAANWLTAWERTGDDRYRGWLESAMRAIGEAPLGFLQGDFGYDTATKRLIPGAVPEGDRIRVSHLSAVFGLFEVCAELIGLIDVPSFKAAWLQYCALYLADEDTQRRELGRVLTGINLRVAHSRLAAFAAHELKREDLAEIARREFRRLEWGPEPTLKTERIEGPTVLNPVDEAVWVSTNDTSQWGLAAIQNLALIDL